MRKSVRKFWITACLLVGSVPVTASAQSIVSESGFEGFRNSNIYYGPVEVEGRAQVHLVEPGDTLWTLSETYFGTADAWPTLWGMNPQVTNPHWIYPGDTIFLEYGLAPSKTVRPNTTSPYPKPQPRTSAGRIARTVGFIADQEYRSQGRIVSARSERELLVERDEVYLKLPDDERPEVGALYTIYREGREIEHPISGDSLGNLVHFLGVVRVIGNESKLVKGIIAESRYGIERGERLTEYFDQLHVVEPRTNRQEVEAVVIDTYQNLEYYGEVMYVFIDKGAEDGVELGNRFVLRDRGDYRLLEDDNMEYDLEDYPWERTGEALIVEVYEHHCLALMTDSIREHQAGHSAIMPEGY